MELSWQEVNLRKWAFDLDAERDAECWAWVAATNIVTTIHFSHFQLSSRLNTKIEANMHNGLHKILKIFLFTFSLVNCQSTPSELPYLHNTHYNGNATVRLTEKSTYPSLSVTITINLSQNGNAVEGTWSTSSGSSGTLSGTILGSRFNSISLIQIKPCESQFAGTAIIFEKGRKLIGTFSGETCAGQQTISFEVVRQ